MINIEELAKRAINQLKLDFKLPSHGFLTGGSIANLIWEFVSGNKAVINDIDIFILEGDKRLNKENRLYEFEKKESIYYDDSYGGINYRNKVNEYYEISKSLSIGKINEIYYVSNTNDPKIIIDSFDLNCVQIGYLIEEDKFYWTKDFEKFIRKGELKVVNLLTPAHTLLRLVKKSEELNANYNNFEINLLKHVINYHLNGIIRTRFKSRYKEMWDKYSDKLENDFILIKDKGLEDHLLNKYNESSEIWTLSTIKYKTDGSFDIFTNSKKSVFNDDNLDKIYTCTEFLFYMRNVYGNNKLSKMIWNDLRYLFIENYLDIIPDKKDFELLARLVRWAPKSINTLRGLKISEQIKRVKFILEEFKHDPIIGISILEKHKEINTDIELDESTKLILELTVRKDIINDTNGKVSKILES
jgi:CRISPR/Cas system CMR-associated protein Cmr5 small subunit